MSITQDQATSSAVAGAEPVYVTVSLDSVTAPAVAWRVTFLSHLEVRAAELSHGLGTEVADLDSSLDEGNLARLRMAGENCEEHSSPHQLLAECCYH